MHKTFDIIIHQETLFESNLNYVHYRRFIIAFRRYLSRISVKYSTSVFQLEQVATCETICHAAVCGAPRKQRIKRGQSHISAQHSRIYISPSHYPLPKHFSLFLSSYHSRFFLSPSSSDPQGRSLSLVVMFLVSAERTRRLHVRSTARPFVRTGYGGGAAGRYARARNFEHEMDNSGRRLAA